MWLLTILILNKEWDSQFKKKLSIVLNTVPEEFIVSGIRLNMCHFKLKSVWDMGLLMALNINSEKIPYKFQLSHNRVYTVNPVLTKIREFSWAVIEMYFED